MSPRETGADARASATDRPATFGARTEADDPPCAIAQKYATRRPPRLSFFAVQELSELRVTRTSVAIPPFRFAR